MATKVILVDGQALDAKYGDRANEVWQALDKLIEADGNRGIESQLVRIDDPEGPAGSTAIESGAGWVEVKAVVDAVFEALSPDYLLLLGGPDLFPHCDLDNPTEDDEDQVVPSDLPYACDAAASTAAADFIAPTRVVSRLPDVPGATDPEVLLTILAFARGWESRERGDYDAYLGITAEVWEGSTRLSLTQLYGNATEMQISPPDGPGWSASLLGRLSHFANLHGAPRSTQYYGQHGSHYPVAHDAAVVEGSLAEGTVGAAEACYGAELFDPEGGQLAMPFAYLDSGAYGFFGSTTIAWGPSDSNDWADVFCLLFQASVLRGASIGRAGLEARQEYVAQSAPLDPIDLKTLAQFLILGDPSVQPVSISTHAAAPAGKSAVSPGLPERRERLRAKGDALSKVASWVQPLEGEPDERVISALREIAAVQGAGEAKVSSFALSGGAEVRGVHAYAGEAEPPQAPATMHLLMQEVEIKDAPMRQRVAVLAVAEDGEIVSVKRATMR